MPMSRDKKIVIIAGANGAGKTTFARQFLPQEAQCPRFVNADLIAAGLSPFTPETASLKAGRLMLEQIREYVHAGESFGFETTLSGRTYARQIPDWQHLYKPLVDSWAVYDNSGRFPREIDASNEP